MPAKRYGWAPFIFLTVHEDEDFIAAAFSAGASGYVTKSRVTTDLVLAIRQVMEGNTYVSRLVET